MKKLLTFLSINLILLSCQKSKLVRHAIPVDESIEFLNGPIKQVITNEETKNETEQTYHSEIYLNKHGDSIKVEQHRHGMIFDFKYNIIYNSLGKKTGMLGYVNVELPFEENSVYQQRRGALLKKPSNIYTYDNDDHIIKLMSLSKDSSGESYTYKYNQKGDMIESDFHVNSHLLMDIIKLTYDDKHMVVEENQFHNGNLMHHINYSYLAFDTEGNWIRRKVFYDGQTITLARKITYY